MAEKVPLFIVAVTAVVIKGDKFLAGKRAMSEVAFPGLWTVPGGKMEPGKTILEHLRDEIREEAGVEVENIFFVGDFSFTRPDRHLVLGLEFGCDYLSGDPKAGDDMDSMRWLAIEEAEKRNFIPGVVEYVKKTFEIHKK